MPQSLFSLSIVSCLTAVFLFSSCSDSEMITVAAENSRLKAEMKRMQTGAATEKEKAIAEIKAENGKLREEIQAQLEGKEGAAAVQQELEATRQELEELLKKFEDYKDTYRASVRERSKGKELGELVYRDKSYSGVKIRSIDDLGISVSHTNGVMRMEFAHLSVDMQNEYAYNPMLADNAAQGESASRAAFAEKLKEIESMEAQHNSSMAAKMTEENKLRSIRELQLEITRGESRMEALTNKLDSTSSTAASYSKTRSDRDKLSAWLAQAKLRLSQMGSSMPYTGTSSRSSSGSE